MNEENSGNKKPLRKNGTRTFRMNSHNEKKE
jgi:hypothetical protein